MSEIKHTPGPWICFVPFKGRYPIVQRGRSGGFQVIAVNKDSALADARLIAAAPELLEALKEFVNNSSVQSGFPSLCEEAEKAITKAEGGE